MTLRWGICATGKISTDFAACLCALPDSEHIITAVAASSLDRAQEFSKRFKVTKAYGSYSDLAKDDNVDVVYIGSINTKHTEQIKLMLNGGKHVLCEKPMCLTVKDATEVTALAIEKNLFLMEAVWSRFFPAYQMVKNCIADGEIGEVNHVQATFGINARTVKRLLTKDMGGGSIYDLGIYAIQLAQFIFDETPSEVFASGFLNQDGVDEMAAMTLKYSERKIASLSCSFLTNMPNEACISGSKGYIRIHMPFWCPTRITVNEKVYDFELPEIPFEFNFTNSAGLTYEAQEVRRCILEGRTQSTVVPHSTTLGFAKIIRKLRNDLGYKLDED